jgi:hypothetical protein
VRSPSLLLKDSTGGAIFLPIAPLKKPRTEFGCQPVSFASSFKVTPPGRFSRSMIFSFLLPPGAAVAGFFVFAASGACSPLAPPPVRARHFLRRDVRGLDLAGINMSVGTADDFFRSNSRNSSGSPWTS